MVNSVECSTYIEQGQKKGDFRSIDSPHRYPRGGEQGEFPWSVPYEIPTDKLARDYLCPDNEWVNWVATIFSIILDKKLVLAIGLKFKSLCSSESHSCRY